MTASVRDDGECPHCRTVDELREDVAEVRAVLERIEENMVTRGEFGPVRAVAYGLVGLMSVSLMGILVDAVMK